MLNLFTVQLGRSIVEVQALNGKCSRIINEKLRDSYCLRNIVRVIKSRILSWTGHVARMEEGRTALKILTGEPTEKRPLGRSRRRREDNIRMNLKKYLSIRGNGMIKLRISIIGGPFEGDIEPTGAMSHVVS